MLQRAAKTLSPFETQNIIHTLQHLTVKSAVGNPWFVAGFLVLAFYAIIKKSMFVLSSLFTAAAVMLLIHFTLPVDGGDLSLSTTLPFAFGGIAIGAVLIYLTFIKSE